MTTLLEFDSDSPIFMKHLPKWNFYNRFLCFSRLVVHTGSSITAFGDVSERGSSLPEYLSELPFLGWSVSQVNVLLGYSNGVLGCTRDSGHCPPTLQ